MLNKQINWDNFRITNNDARGVRYKFQDLCRQLFINEFLLGNEGSKSPHSNPNNPGIESEPIYQESTNRWLGYQVKFFDDRVKYDQILKSAKETVDKYAGRLNCVILYCNKPLSSSAAGYKATERLLNENGISLELRTDEVILDQAGRDPYLSAYYFGAHNITKEWFAEHNNRMFIELGERFNAKFNIATDISQNLSLFVRDAAAVDYINGKKKELINKIETLGWEFDQYSEYLAILKQSVDNISDIDEENLEDSLKWKNFVNEALKDQTDKLISTRQILDREADELYKKMLENSSVAAKEQEQIRNKYYDNQRRKEVLNTVLNLPQMLSLTETEQQSINNNILLVRGDAGTGKSQLLAHEANCLMDENRCVFLLLAGDFFTNDPIQKQIMSICELDYSFDELINILECLGETQGHIIPVMIDALNETWNINLWARDLPIIITKIKHCKYVKLVCTYRSEYENSLINNSLLTREEDYNLYCVIHKGFAANVIEAAKQFFDYYDITFTLFELFEYKMENPLFLSLYCKTYTGDEVDLPVLYNRVLLNANENIQKKLPELMRNLGYMGEDIVTPFIMKLADWFVKNKVKFISKEDVYTLSYWDTYKITPPVFIEDLIRENILNTSLIDEKEILYFSYDQMNDYYCAKVIIDSAESREEVRKRIIEDVLQIQDGTVERPENRDLFTNICALYKDKFGEECIDIIDLISDEWDRDQLFDTYISSFKWRDRRTIDADFFLKEADKYHVNTESFWDILICNSVKTDHPLNADFLHTLLMHYEFNKRDYLWTIYINGIYSDNENRLTQLITMYNNGDSIKFKNKKQKELLLTLFGWLLTASDRNLRDYASKAMVEILKMNFELCEPLLKKFEGVNDPYVIQRLYSIVFGACCKRSDDQREIFQTLSEYTYLQVFDQEMVYPDILLRDYARLIIERFLWEYPDYNGFIDKNKIKPPYGSDPIPRVTDNYKNMHFKGGIGFISRSMKFEGMGMYGDFGRYVFQSNLRYFDVNYDNIYNYAMSFIINELGYKEEWFDEYDAFLERNFNRYQTIKTERIGKKYQWITMYNILARISDHCKMKDECYYSFSDNVPEVSYEGAWELYVRDFDPTLNLDISCDCVPTFRVVSEYINNARTETVSLLQNNNITLADWADYEDMFIKSISDMTAFADDTGCRWVPLTEYFDIGDDILNGYKSKEWCWLYAYFMTVEQENLILQNINEDMRLKDNDFVDFNEEYVLYYREYPWSPACYSFKKNEWIDAYLKTNDSKIYVGRVLQASSELIWECEYDATKPESGAASVKVPCSELIDRLQLKFSAYDGLLYDEDGRPAIFDAKTTKDYSNVVVRKDLIDKFLKLTGMKLIWVVDAEKEVYSSDVNIAKYGEWSGLISYDGKSVKSYIYKVRLS